MIDHRILIINIKQNNERTGATIYADEIFQLARKNGMFVNLLVPEGSKIGSQEGVITVPYYRNKIFRWLYYIFIVPFYAWSYDIVHFSLDLPLISTRIAYFFSHKKVITTIHDLGEFQTRRYSLAKDFFRRIIVRFEILFSQHYIVVSETTKNDLINIFHIKERDISLVYNYVKEKEISNNSTLELSQFAFLEEMPFMLYVSSLNHPLKNHVMLVEAFEATANRLIDFQLVFVGARLSNYQVILDKIERSPFRNRIHYLGYLNDDEVSYLYKKAVFYIFPSRFEGFGRGVVEAWQNKVPLACSSGGSLKEIVGDAGLLFSPDSIEEITSAIFTLVDNRQLQEELIQKGCIRLLMFSEDNVYNQLVNAYQRVLLEI